MGKLDGRVALVSGGARGLGLAMAEAFVDEGAKVVIGDVLDDEAAGAAQRLGDAAWWVHLDVTDEASWDAAVAATVGRFGHLDVLVNNAGTAEGAPLLSRVSYVSLTQRVEGRTAAGLLTRRKSRFQ